MALCCSGTMHPLKMSTTQLVYAQSKLQFTTHIFTDDLEATLKTYEGAQQIDLINKGLDKNALSALKKHYLENFKVYCNHKPVALDIKKAYFKNNKVEVVYIEGTSEKLATPQNLTVRNTLLFKIIPEQKNVINADMEGKGEFDKTLIFENDNPPFEKEL